uniref:Tubulin--tyrosine ligase n=1 Tax=Chromera velia CCMP2878 TaxID=1169474 RepID=A0A0G4HR11_9ALVE|eukprot:Cvel_8021.t1-p1 / transcript=Cvel_8021.t1 / gene=Cvel_8021 / organism=Chromera_velia_CCMP2878 / gene_product=hypothetical protein / transcript_product=hypothetical protein / location=Cvel_scaffold433:58643-60274(+) / protein_length=544 / sequence_SO=supercontig / SO=protein_coding / is_pseudo=false
MSRDVLVTHDRVFWDGVHSLHGISSPLSKVRAPLRSVFLERGWRKTDCTAECGVPLLSLRTRRTGDFECNPEKGSMLPLIRQLQQSHSDALDDKRLLAALLEDSFSEHTEETDERKGRVTPRTWLPKLSQTGGQRALSICNFPPREHETPSHGFFLKHRHGVKGRAVTHFRSSAALMDTLGKIQSPEDFVIQEAVPPLQLPPDGRKFAIRAHALLVTSPVFRLWVHRGSIVVLPHAAPYSRDSSDKAAHVSQMGRHHPSPFLLDELEAQLPSLRGSAGGVPGVRAQINRAAAEVVSAAACRLRCSRCPPLLQTQREGRSSAKESGGDSDPQGDCVTHKKGEGGNGQEEPSGALPEGAPHHGKSRLTNRGAGEESKGRYRKGERCPDFSCLPRVEEQLQAPISVCSSLCSLRPVLYQLMGLDFVIDEKGRVVLLEVNTYPALGDGTMSAVPTGVYRSLLDDFIVLVLGLAALSETAPTSESSGSCAGAAAQTKVETASDVLDWSEIESKKTFSPFERNLTAVWEALQELERAVSGVWEYVPLSSH